MRYFASIFCVVFVVCCYATVASAKRKLPIRFEPVYGKTLLRLDDTVNNFHIQTFRFYISGIEFYDGEKLQWKVSNSYHLIDASLPESLQLQLNAPELLHFNTIKFKLGIDSATNISGALGGDLDPTKGMYWSWQSGYINFKLEGTSPACNTRNNEFHFHIGGYAAPFASVQEVALKIDDTEHITILADAAKFMEGIDLATLNNIMIPCVDAVSLSKKGAAIFSIEK